MKNKLYYDNFIKNEGFDSTEEYIFEGIKSGCWIKFPSLQYYLSLFNEGWLREKDSIRTSDMGQIDEHYKILKDGKLEGITEIPVYQGKEGIFTPEEIFRGRRISDGWSVIYTTFMNKEFVMEAYYNRK